MISAGIRRRSFFCFKDYKLKLHTHRFIYYLLLSLLLLSLACDRHPEKKGATAGADSNGLSGNDGQNYPATDSNALFEALPVTTTHIDFSNTLTEGLNTNVLLYEYFYNGGGVAIGDMNGDGLQDIYFWGI